MLFDSVLRQPELFVCRITFTINQIGPDNSARNKGIQAHNQHAFHVVYNIFEKINDEVREHEMEKGKGCVSPLEVSNFIRTIKIFRLKFVA